MQWNPNTNSNVHWEWLKILFMFILAIKIVFVHCFLVKSSRMHWISATYTYMLTSCPFIYSVYFILASTRKHYTEEWYTWVCKCVNLCGTKKKLHTSKAHDVVPFYTGNCPAIACNNSQKCLQQQNITPIDHWQYEFENKFMAMGNLNWP